MNRILWKIDTSEENFEGLKWQIMLDCGHKTCCGLTVLLEYVNVIIINN